MSNKKNKDQKPDQEKPEDVTTDAPAEGTEGVEGNSETPEAPSEGEAGTENSAPETPEGETDAPEGGEDAPETPTEPELTEEEIQRQAEADEAEKKAAKEAKAVNLKVEKRAKARKKQADDFKADHEENKKKGLLIYGINKGARFGELSVDADITVVIKAENFDRKSEMLEALRKLDLAIREDRGNE